MVAGAYGVFHQLVALIKDSALGSGVPVEHHEDHPHYPEGKMKARNWWALVSLSQQPASPPPEADETRVPTLRSRDGPLKGFLHLTPAPQKWA